MSDITERLLRKIRFGEDSFLEYEEVVLAEDRFRGPGREQLADALAAFANAAGGLERGPMSSSSAAIGSGA